MEPTLLQAFDFAGVAVFAATGALAASRRQMDVIGFAFMASATGMGGGTLRDLLLGTTPVFWIRDPTYVVVCLVVAVAVYFTAHLAESRYRLLLWADAIGLAAYSVMGANKSLAVGATPLGAVVMGMMTATFGGIIRDIVAGEPSVIMRKEIYVTAALVGAALYVGLIDVGLPLWPAAIGAAIVAFLVRAGALLYGWTLPGYRSRPGRPQPND